MEQFYLINQHGHYFVVSCPLSIATCTELRCQFLASEEEMFEQLARNEGVTVDEFDGMAIHVRKNDNGFEVTDLCEQWHELELAGCTIEEWLSDFVL